ncbi:zinc-binding dehydrogenase [Geobacter sp. DSM 9736]|uniref:MDR/zinc-dependent alcohol dehydrogenase-like family protein n=1 Tax=Geobacter sp. DSM 9736 TaxID=1277350 RepID=UPI000B504539
MQAAVITSPGKVEVRESPLQDPKAGELLIRVEGCGVCPSNLPLWEGRPWFNYPIPPGTPGHEGWGRVCAVGKGVAGFAEGDRVTFLSDHAYAEYDTITAEAAVKLPAELEGLPFPGEAVGCAVNVFRRSAIRAGDTVAVVGAGFLGIIFTALASRAGARVIALSRRQHPLDLALSYGAAEAVSMDDHWRVIEKMKELAGPAGCDVVVEATGHQWPLDLSGELVKERGRMVIAGYHQDGPRQVNMQQWNWKGLDVINAHEREARIYVEGIAAGVEAAAGRAFDLEGLVTHSFGLDSLNEAYAMLTERPEGFIKGIVSIHP